MEKVQRKCLASYLGVPISAGIETLEVEAEIFPHQLKREELVIRQLVKIMAKKHEGILPRPPSDEKKKLRKHQKDTLLHLAKCTCTIRKMLSNMGQEITVGTRVLIPRRFGSIQKTT